jgi:type I restriction enzyme, S subunit
MNEQQPLDWGFKKLGDLFKILKGSINPQDNPAERLEYYSIPVFDQTGSAALVRGSEIESNKTLIAEPAILVSKLNPRKPRVQIVKPAGEHRKCASTEFIAYSPRNREIDLRFYKFYFLSEKFSNRFQRVATGSTNSHVRVAPRETLNWKLPLPPFLEQQKIATILSCVDDVIEKTHAHIDRLGVLKTGMMQELLTKGIGHTELKDSPVGRIPVGWNVVELKNIAAVKGGKRMPKGRAFADHATPHPYIRVSDFCDGTVSRENLRYVLPEDQASIKRYTIGKNDLYISIAGTIGLVGSIPADLDGAQLTENAAKIVFHDLSKVCPNYIKFLLSSAAVQDRLNQEKGTGGGVPKLALFRIETTLIPLPEFTEQRKIASVLDSIDRRIAGDKQNLKNLTKLKKGLMRDFLTGKVRVNVQQKETVAA